MYRVSVALGKRTMAIAAVGLGLTIAALLSARLIAPAPPQPPPTFNAAIPLPPAAPK